MGYKTIEEQKAYASIYNKRKYQANKYKNENCEKRLATKLNTFLNELIETKECNQEITKKYDIELLIERLRTLQQNLPIQPLKQLEPNTDENTGENENNNTALLLDIEQNGEPQNYIIKPRERTAGQKRGWEKARQVRDMNRYKRAKEKEAYMKQLEEYKEQIKDDWKKRLLEKAVSIKKQQILNEALDEIEDCNISYEEVCRIKKQNEEKKQQITQLQNVRFF